MNRWIISACATLVVFSLAVGSVVAQNKPDKGKVKPGPTKDVKKPAQAKCPVCGMFLAKQPTKSSTVAVRLKKGGPVMYCCSKCKMPAEVLVKKPGPPAKHGKMGKMKM